MLWLAHYLFWAEAENLSGMAQARRDSEDVMEFWIEQGWIDPWLLMAISVQQMAVPPQASMMMPLALPRTPPESNEVRTRCAVQQLR